MFTRLIHPLAAIAAACIVILCSAAAAQPASDDPFVGPPAPNWMRFDPVVELPDTPAGAQAEWLLSVLRGADAEPLEARMSQTLLAQVSVEGFRQFIAQAREALGWAYPTHIITSTDNSLTVYLQTATDEARWVLQANADTTDPAQLAAVILQPAPNPEFPRAESWDELSARIDASGYEPSVVVWEITADGRIAPVFTKNDSRSLNISGASSVFVLGATAQKIASELGASEPLNPWESMIAFDPALRSVPDSPMSQATVGAEFPVATYAGQMLQGDDTATEHLIKWTTPRAIADFIAKIADDTPVDAPYLTTRQAYALKLSFDAELRTKYAQASEPERQEILASLTPPDAGQLKLWVKPQDIATIGHFASARELASALNYLRNATVIEGMEPLREILGANQQVKLDSGYWRSVAFTAGAEPGVLATCFILERNDNRWFLAVTIFNRQDEPLSGQVTSPILLAMLDLLQRQ